MALAYTKWREDTFETLQINAGVVATDFDTATGALDEDDIVGATTGGITFTATPNFSDFGEDVDNVPNNTKQLKVLEDYTVTLAGTFVTANTAAAKLLTGAADVTAGTSGAADKIEPRADLDDTDFSTLWFIGDYGDRKGNGGFVAIKLIDALNTNGFQLQTTKNGKGQFAFSFMGHYDLTDATRTPPFEIYIKTGVTTNNGGGGGGDANNGGGGN